MSPFQICRKECMILLTAYRRTVHTPCGAPEQTEGGASKRRKKQKQRQVDRPSAARSHTGFYKPFNSFWKAIDHFGRAETCTWTSYPCTSRTSSWRCCDASCCFPPRCILPKLGASYRFCRRMSTLFARFCFFLHFFQKAYGACRRFRAICHITAYRRLYLAKTTRWCIMREIKPQ